MKTKDIGVRSLTLFAMLAAAACVCPEKKPMPAPEPVAAAEPVGVVEAPPAVLTSFFLGEEHFDFDKATLKQSGITLLRDNVQLMKDNPNSRAHIEGYTSKIGTVKYNQGLSERRANTVQEFLIGEGISADRITAVGYGEKWPARPEPNPRDKYSPAAKANMRVLIIVTVK